MSSPTTMKAVYQPDPKSTKLVLNNTPLPAPHHPEDCLIRVYTASPCLGELHWEENFPHLFNNDRERIPCTEAAGVIVTVPEGTTQFQPGDEVLFRLEPSMTGNLREYTIGRLSQLAHKPKNVSWVVAGATSLSSLTAWQGVFDRGVLDPKGIFGDEDARKQNAKLSVLITGASGVVGSWAVQLAALAGAGEVVAYAGGSSAEHVRSLGATEVLDYKAINLRDWFKSHELVDAILDCVGGSTLESCWYAVKDGGVLLSVAGNPGGCKPEGMEKTLKAAEWFLVEPKGSQLELIARLLGEGRCSTQVDSEVELEDFQAAFDKVEERKARGKVVIKVVKL